MYILIYRPDSTHRDTIEMLEGNWPINYVESLLEKNYTLIVISLYSNTIKVPTKEIDQFNDRVWNEFPIPNFIFKKLKG